MPVLLAVCLAAMLGSATPAERPFRGLRAELNAADAVLRIRVTAVQPLDPPGTWDGNRTHPERLQVDLDVEKVLAGPGVLAGRHIRLVFPAREYFAWAANLSGFEVLSGVHVGRPLTALVRTDGDRLELLLLMRADDAERTDAFFEAYARLAREGDQAFTRGLAKLLADRVRLTPDRLLWVNWAVLAFDDWERLRVPIPVTDPALLRLARDTHRAVSGQIEETLQGRGEGVNLWELPWLIRVLPRKERREMTAGLLRMHPMIAKELADAGAAVRPCPYPEGDPRCELTVEDMRAMWAIGDMNALMRCLAACVDPQAPVEYPHEEVLRRARAFAR